LTIKDQKTIIFLKGCYLAVYLVFHEFIIGLSYRYDGMHDELMLSVSQFLLMLFVN
jgi:hypothetical protein